MEYDVIIGGGSFAGLAAASQLRGKRVLLVEPNPIGRVQTSACGTLLAVLEATGTMDSLLQIHENFVLHLPSCEYRVPLPDPFCTFDFHIFCDRLLSRCDAEILSASIRGHLGQMVYTSRGVFNANMLIDATGWRAALATNGKQQGQPHKGKSFGIETHVPILENGLHFWYQPNRLGERIVTWLFPTGGQSRVGIGSYLGDTRLKSALDEWLAFDLAQSMDGVHGGFFPHRLQPAITDDVFRVGDAAGQCLALTGEGIRPALYFGAAVGRLACLVIEGDLGKDEAHSTYLQFVRSHSYKFQTLLFLQNFLTGIPVSWVERLACFVDHNDLFPHFMRLYRRLMEPARIADPDLAINYF